MLSAETFLEDCAAFGIRLFSGVPCSHLSPLIDAARATREIRYVGAANEGEAAAIAAGSALAGTPAAVFLQNSGLGNAVSPLTSLHAIFKVPVLLVVSWRGEPGRERDEPQHDLMGKISPELLELMGIRWEKLPAEPSGAYEALIRARTAMSDGRSYALLVGKGTFAPGTRAAPAARKPLAHVVSRVAPKGEPLTRETALVRTQAYAAARGAALIATTGHTGRHLYALGDEPNQFYVVGSMGCASSLALGVAIAKPERPVVILDGDGAALMRLGALATLGYERPPNLMHVLFDNEAHGSTGGQPTVSASIDLAEIARACGYPEVIAVSDDEGFERALGAVGNGCAFIHVKILQEENSSALPRPRSTPPELAARFSGWLEGTA